MSSVGLGTILSELSASIGVDSSAGGILAEGFLTNASAQMLLGVEGYVYEVSCIILVNTSGAGRIVDLYSSMLSAGPDYPIYDKAFALAANAKILIEFGIQLGFDNILRGKADVGAVVSYVIFGKQRRLSK